jgi:hypothetical protein
MTIIVPNLEGWWKLDGDLTDSSGNNRFAEHIQAKCEWGSTTVSSTIDDGNVQSSISFVNTYTDPIVVCFIPSRNGNDTVQCRAKDITSTGCTLFMQEPDNEPHNSETINYMVFEQGQHYMSGVEIVADKATVGTSSTTVNLPVSTIGSPALVYNLGSYNNGDFAACRCWNLSSSSFTAEIFDMQSATGVTSEDIHYLAVYGGDTNDSGNFRKTNGTTINWEALVDPTDGTSDGVDDTPHTITYAGSFSSAPIVLVSVASRNGGDECYARASGTLNNSTGIEIYAEEGLIQDTERAHADEEFSYFALADVAGENSINSDFSYTSTAPFHQALSSTNYAIFYVQNYEQDADVETLSEVTVTGWIKPSGSTESQVIISLDRSAFWAVSYNRNNTNNAIDWNTSSSAGGGIDDQSSTIDLNDGQWHHFACVFDANATNQKKIYIDGVLDVEKSAHSGNSLGGPGTGESQRGLILRGNSEWDVNTNLYAPGYPFLGETSNIKYYKVALSPNDVARDRLGLHPIQVPGRQ